MTFSIIGTGNIAWFLGNRLSSSGHHCKGIYGRDTVAVSALGEAVLSDNAGSIGNIKDGEADVCFLAVSDMAIKEVAKMVNFKKTVLIITAGAIEINIVANAAKDRAVLWPIYSITKNNLPAHRNIPCCWEATTEKATRYVLSMGHAITDILFETKGEQRKWLHLSAVIGNNFTNHLLTICEQICNENNLPFSILLPIIDQTYKKTEYGSPYYTQTGPAIRGDINTISEHLSILKDSPTRHQIYETITKSIQKMYHKDIE